MQTVTSLKRQADVLRAVAETATDDRLRVKLFKHSNKVVARAALYSNVQKGKKA